MYLLTSDQCNQDLNFQDQDFIWNAKTRPRPRLIVDQDLNRDQDLSVQD